MHQCLHTASQLSKEEMESLFRSAWLRMKSWDSVPREFENVNILFEITLSASCFGQMKRHRMSTQISQPYDPSLGVTVPESIKTVGMENQFMVTIGMVEEAYNAIRDDVPAAAPYILTNSHRKRILLNVNPRELYHISRLREDEHAQWDIRNISAQMLSLARKAVPLVFDFACGKDKFSDKRKELFGDVD
jgi:thymidylate synthase ThyX